MPINNGTYIQGEAVRARMCSLCNALVQNTEETRYAHEMFHEHWIPKAEVNAMSDVKWCDPGDHAFKAGCPGSQSMTGSEVDADGIARQVNMHACAQHAYGPSISNNTRALPRTYDDDDH